MKKFVLHFIGHSCTGKSTIEKLLFEKLPGSYVVSYDNLKWKLSGYERGRDSSFVQKIARGFFKTVCETGTSVLLLIPISTLEDYYWYKKVAEDNGYAFLSFELTAPKEILLERFRGRLASASLGEYKISIKNEETFIENLSKEFFVPPATPLFDTSILSSEEITNKILHLLP